MVALDYRDTSYHVLYIYIYILYQHLEIYHITCDIGGIVRQSFSLVIVRMEKPSISGPSGVCLLRLQPVSHSFPAIQTLIRYAYLHLYIYIGVDR
jgi:hypothetical protein